MSRKEYLTDQTVASLAPAQDAAEQRIEDVLNGYRKAFAGFSDEELAILDGVILKPTGRH